MVAYIRQGSSTVEARGDDERELMSLAADVPCDDRVNQQPEPVFEFDEFHSCFQVTRSKQRYRLTDAAMAYPARAREENS